MFSSFFYYLWIVVDDTNPESSEDHGTGKKDSSWLDSSLISFIRYKYKRFTWEAYQIAEIWRVSTVCQCVYWCCRRRHQQDAFKCNLTNEGPLPGWWVRLPPLCHVGGSGYDALVLNNLTPLSGATVLSLLLAQPLVREVTLRCWNLSPISPPDSGHVQRWQWFNFKAHALRSTV